MNPADRGAAAAATTGASCCWRSRRRCRRALVAAHPALDRRLHAEGRSWTLTVARRHRLARRSPLPLRERVVLPAADALEPARRAARGRLLDPRARRPRATTPLGAGACSRSTPWPRRCASSASAPRGDGAAAQGDGGDRRRGLRVRRRRAAAAGQPRRRAAARPAGRAAARPRAPTELGLGAVPDAATPPRIVDAAFPGGVGPLGGAPQRSFRQGGLPHQLLVLSDLSRRCARRSARRGSG